MIPKTTRRQTQKLDEVCRQQADTLVVNNFSTFLRVLVIRKVYAELRKSSYHWYQSCQRKRHGCRYQILEVAFSGADGEIRPGGVRVCKALCECCCCSRAGRWAEILTCSFHWIELVRILQRFRAGPEAKQSWILLKQESPFLERNPAIQQAKMSAQMCWKDGAKA